MSIFNQPAQQAQPTTDWRTCYPAWAAIGLIPLHPAAGNTTGKEPVYDQWTTIPARRKAIGESKDETFNDIAHEIERGRNIGLVVPEGTICLDLDNPDLLNTVLSLYPTAAAQLTQGGGVHLFFRVLPGEEFTATRKAEIDGIEYDIRSAERSQVACYPSLGLKGRYTWLRYLPVDKDDLPLRPDSLLKYLATNTTQGNAPVVHQHYGPMPLNPVKPENKQLKPIKQIDNALYGRITKGRPLTMGVGGRNNEMIRAVGMILGTCTPPGEAPSPELPFAALLPSIVADTTGDTSNPPPTTAELWSACCRLCDQETAKWFERQSLISVVAKAAHEIRQLEEAKSDEVAAKISEKLNVNPEELKKQAILYLPNGRHYYVLDERVGGYAGPVSGNGLLQRITEGCPSLFNSADIYDVSPQGIMSMRPVHFIIRDYGKPVTRIDRLAGLTVPQYDKHAETMTMGVWQLKELTPEFNEQIDTWLKLLGKEDYNALAQWLATVCEVNRPNSCLYIKGPKAIGKSLLVDGLARLWGRKATRYRDVMARFNDSFLNCPLVHLDEGLSDRTDSLRFREFISEVEHVIESKGQPQYTLRGSARVIVTSNNVNALKINEALNTDDIDAISSRIMWVSTDHEAATYLKRLKGRRTTEEWVENDLIAKHVLWLKENTEVQIEGHENRFMVPGVYHPEKMHMLRTHRSNSTLFEVVASYVIDAASAHLNNRQVMKYEEGVLFTEGTVAIRWKGLSEYWRLHETRFGKVISPRDASESLKIFSRESEKSKRTSLGPRKFYIADYELLMDEIERLAPIELIKDIEDFIADSVDDRTTTG